MKHKVIARFKVGNPIPNYELKKFNKRSKHALMVLEEVRTKLKKEAQSQIREHVKFNEQGILYTGSGRAGDIKEAFKR